MTSTGQLAVRTGVDIVRLDEFRQSRVRAGDAFDRRLFTPEELAGARELASARESGGSRRTEGAENARDAGEAPRASQTAQAAADLRLAGLFAAKEAAFKAIGLPKGRWHVVEVVHDSSGRPSLRFGDGFDASHIASCDVSISHTGDYVVAVVTALVRPSGS